MKETNKQLKNKQKTIKFSPAGWRETRGLPGNNSELLVRSEESPDMLICWYADMLICWYASMLICCYADMLICWYVQWCYTWDWMGGLGISRWYEVMSTCYKIVMKWGLISDQCCLLAKFFPMIIRDQLSIMCTFQSNDANKRNTVIAMDAFSHCQWQFVKFTIVTFNKSSLHTIRRTFVKQWW